MTTKAKRIIIIVETVVILILAVLCVYLWKYEPFKNTGKNEVSLIHQEDTVYTYIYENESLKELKNENERLYDELSQLKNGKSAIEIEYRYELKTDTVYVPLNESLKDSVYHYSYDNDTISYDLLISAFKIKWYKVSMELNDRFSIVESKLNENTNSLIVNHSENLDIINVDAWKKKRSFKEHIFYGPCVGLGYGVFNNNFDLYVGVSAGYKF